MRRFIGALVVAVALLIAFSEGVRVGSALYVPVCSQDDEVDEFTGGAHV